MEMIEAALTWAELQGKLHFHPTRDSSSSSSPSFFFYALLSLPLFLSQILSRSSSVRSPPPRVGGRYPCGPVMSAQTTYVEYQKTLTLRNNFNLKKETLKIVPDGQNPGKFLVTFVFDAAAAGSITVMFLAKEGEEGNLIPMKEDIFKPVTVDLEKGLRQKFWQPAGTGIDLSAVEEELFKSSEMDGYPLAIKADALPDNQTGAKISQITQAVIEYHQVGVLKQILWVNNNRYELQDIYQTGNSMEDDLDGSNWRKECAICLSEPCDTIVLPCRHMCMCNGCAKVLMFQTDRCPICRQPADQLSSCYD